VRFTPMSEVLLPTSFNGDDILGSSSLVSAFASTPQVNPTKGRELWVTTLLGSLFQTRDFGDAQSIAYSQPIGS